MAVRAFDLSEPQSSRLRGLDVAAPRRRDARRAKSRYAMIGLVALTIPFLGALVALGVVR